jgi:hypothetical protein
MKHMLAIQPPCHHPCYVRPEIEHIGHERMDADAGKFHSESKLALFTTTTTLLKSKSIQEII